MTAAPAEGSESTEESGRRDRTWSAGRAALVCLAFVFWGWGELRPDVPRWVADATGGHRLASGSGKV
ncbi:hypothetical protein [Promicromonospora iranensis]|uniref:Uncharacterized protein n=1 Tax=Promicromonospora iranensis TaxID=1105144 RepID=A0ABU2CH93_9MICO|nr:hypothetical protein [Promicromonospora iranensis]MDR7380691.1 hypothetical protein [Promicromonospora iranensis]